MESKDKSTQVIWAVIIAIVLILGIWSRALDEHYVRCEQLNFPSGCEEYRK